MKTMYKTMENMVIITMNKTMMKMKIKKNIISTINKMKK